MLIDFYMKFQTPNGVDFTTFLIAIENCVSQSTVCI